MSARPCTASNLTEHCSEPVCLPCALCSEAVRSQRRTRSGDGGHALEVGGPALAWASRCAPLVSTADALSEDTERGAELRERKR